MLKQLALALALGASLLAAACSSGGGGEPSATGEPGGEGQPAAGEELTRVSEAGGVTVEATWLMEGDLSGVDADLTKYPLDEFVVVEISLDAHSGDLNEIEMERAATLRQGASELPPEAWVSVSDDSHHRAGVLVFPRNLRDGPVELILTVGDDDVALLWEAAPSA